MRIKEIKVEGLFGMFNHSIPLNLDSHLTVVYGENGIGKTMLFKLVDWLFNYYSVSNMMSLQNAAFEKLSIVFDNGDSLSYVKKLKNIQIELIRKEKIEQTTLKKVNIEKLVEVIERNLGFVNMGESDSFWNTNTDEILTLEETIIKYEHFIHKKELISLIPSFSPTESKFLKSINLFFIQTQRLFTLNTTKSPFHSTVIEDTATKYANELSLTIKQKTAEYRKLSDDLKNSLGQRIIDKKVKTDFSLRDLQKLAAQINERRKKLQTVGLLENMEDFIIPDDIGDITKAILAVNIQDMQTQLKVYEKDHFYDRLKLFIEILNERRFSYKKISISEKGGFTFTNDNGKQLEAKNLSSGEQHELVLIYELLFKIPKNSLILIDEPEISLHIVWQKEFIKDMEDIIKLRNFDILLATHSPSIINDNWDLTVSLKGKHNEEKH